MDKGHRAHCTRGHPASWGSSPFYTTQRGPITLWGNSPFFCHCGARVHG